MSFSIWIASFAKVDLNFKANTIKNLIIYLESYFKHFFDTKNILYLAKTVTSLLITCNKNEII